MEINAYNSEEYIKAHNKMKEEVLLPDDIILMKEITDEVNRFPTVTVADDLVEMESRLATLSFKLAGLVGRLSSQHEVRSKMLKNDMADYAKSLVVEGKEKSATRAEIAAETEFFSRRVENEVFCGVVDEYKGKAYALKDVFLALTHRIHKFNKNI